MKRKYERIAKKFEKITGFDVVDVSEITDDLSASQKFQRHINWLRDWAEESAQNCERLLMDNNLYGLEPQKDASSVEVEADP